MKMLMTKPLEIHIINVLMVLQIEIIGCSLESEVISVERYWSLCRVPVRITSFYYKNCYDHSVDTYYVFESSASLLNDFPR